MLGLVRLLAFERYGRDCRAGNGMVERIGVDMKHLGSKRRIATIAATIVGVAAVGVAAPMATQPVSAAPCTMCAGGEYHPVAPLRIFDSRHNDTNPDGINDVAPLGAKPTSVAHPTFDVQLLGMHPDISATSSDVLALVVSITVVMPTQPGYLSAYPTGQVPATPSSIINFVGNDVTPNLAIVRPGTDGKLTILLHSGVAGNAHVLVDVFGWVSTSTFTGADPDDPLDERGARLISVNPSRILDTRPSKGGTGPLTVGEDRELTILGVKSIFDPSGPAVVPDNPDIVGVMVNVVGIAPTEGTFVSVVPDAPLTEPTTSNLNLAPGVVKANLVVVPVGADGKIHLFNKVGDTNVAVDVMGYFLKVPDDTRKGRIIPLTAPFRAFDTRKPEFGAVRLGPGQAEAWSFANFAASVTVGGVSVGTQDALLGNLTSAGLTRLYPTVPVSGYLTVYPADGSPRPTVSNLNSPESAAVPNMVLVKYGTSQQVNVFNFAGYAHYLLDVSAVVLGD